MKKIFKDLAISAVIAFMTFYLMYLIKGSILTSDLYNQGIDFLEYFQKHLNIFSKDWIYNWNIALGDNMYALTIYYLLSPFNILLKLVKNIPTIIVLPIFMSIKVMTMAYFTSRYFEKITSSSFRWIGTIIYISSYYIIVYGNYQIMWLDTFVIFPLVLIGIEKIIKEERNLFYIISLFFFISSDYYLAAILIPHIAIYTIIRYIIIKGNKNIFKFILDMIKVSLVPVLLSSFVLIPAFSLMLNSSKEVGRTIEFGYNLENLIAFFNQNYVGNLLSPSNTYITLIGMIVFLPWLIFGKKNIKKLYYIHIFLLVLVLFSDKLNYIFNLGYRPAGGNYRYNLFLNIYIALILYEVIKELINSKNNKLKIALTCMSIINILLIFINFRNKSKKMILFNILLIVIYSVIMLAMKKNKKVLLRCLSVILLIELTATTYYIFRSRDEAKNEVRNRYTNVLQYMKENYGEDGRVEIRDTEWSWNIYMANDISGVTGYHSLINGNYKNMANLLSTTNKEKIRNEFKGRNIISKLVGTKYYLTDYKYCPYRNSKLIDEAYNYYIYEIEDSYFDYYSNDSIITGELPASIVEKDSILYNNLYLNSDLDIVTKDIKSIDLYSRGVINKSKTLNEKITIEKSGDYFIKVPKSSGIEKLRFKVNGNEVGESTGFKNIRGNELDYLELYIGYLKSGDILELNSNLVNIGELLYIDGDYIENNDRSNNITVNNIEKSNTGLKAEVKINEDGYVLMPIVYDDNWNISVDGESVKYYKVNGGFIALNLQAGQNSIEMTYSFNIMYVGIAISSAIFIGIIIFYAVRWKNIRA